MLRLVLAPALVLALLPATAATQKKVQAFAQPSERTSANLLLAELDGNEFVGLAFAATIVYGQPEWKAEYAEKVDELTKGKIFRLGKDYWATYDATGPLAIGGTTVPSGIYYLAVARNQGDQWSLVFIDPAKAKAAGAMPFAPEPAPRTHEVAMKHEKVDREVTKLEVRFTADQANPNKGTLAIAWGNHRLTAAYEVKSDKAGAKDAAADKGEKKENKEK
jgi:hypothetical protein